MDRSRWIALAKCSLGVLLAVSACGDDGDGDTGVVKDGGSPLGQAGASGRAGVSGQAGRAGSAGASGQAGRAGSAGMTSSGTGGSAGAAGATTQDGGTAGSSGVGPCPPNLALPAICRMCMDGSCGVPECKDGRFAAWRCPEDGTEPTGLRWYTSCGHPVCGSDPDPFDDPSIPNCTTERAGGACEQENSRCDGVASCGATLICAKSDPTMGPAGCPRSRARFKQEIDYLSQDELLTYRDQLIDLPLASYRYTSAPSAGPQLGFIIEDIEPSAAVSGDHVNMYGYLSMAVAAIQVQQAQIAELQRELERMRSQQIVERAVCGP